MRAQRDHEWSWRSGLSFQTRKLRTESEPSTGLDPNLPLRVYFTLAHPKDEKSNSKQPTRGLEVERDVQPCTGFYLVVCAHPHKWKERPWLGDGEGMGWGFGRIQWTKSPAVPTQQNANSTVPENGASGVGGVSSVFCVKNWATSQPSPQLPPCSGPQATSCFLDYCRGSLLEFLLPPCPPQSLGWALTKASQTLLKYKTTQNLQWLSILLRPKGKVLQVSTRLHPARLLPGPPTAFLSCLLGSCHVGPLSVSQTCLH